MNNFIHLKSFMLRNPRPIGAANYDIDWIGTLKVQDVINSILEYSKTIGSWGTINISQNKFTSGYGYGQFRDWHGIINNISIDDSDLMKKTIYSGKVYVNNNEMNYYLTLNEDVCKK